MPRAPETGRYVEVHTGPTVGRRAAYLFEVRWSKPLPIESEGDLYLVGCQRTFGPLHYFQFWPDGQIVFPFRDELLVPSSPTP